MANGYDAHSLKASGLDEAASGDMPMGLRTAVRDKRFTRNGIGYRTQQEAVGPRGMAPGSMNPGAVGQSMPEIMYPDGYASGVATNRRGMREGSRDPWKTAQEATSPQIRPRATLEKSGLLEALPPWLQKKAEGDEEEQKEAAVQFVRENMSAFPCEDDARMALAVLSQFVDGSTLDDLQQAIEDQYGDPMEQPEDDWEDMPDDMPVPMGMMGESDLKEAPLDTQKRNKLPDSAFAGPGRTYPIDTPERARSALARVKQFGSDSDIKRVQAAVKKKYPNMDVS